MLGKWSRLSLSRCFWQFFHNSFLWYIFAKFARQTDRHHIDIRQATITINKWNAGLFFVGYLVVRWCWHLTLFILKYNSMLQLFCSCECTTGSPLEGLREQWITLVQFPNTNACFLIIFLSYLLSLLLFWWIELKRFHPHSCLDRWSHSIILAGHFAFNKCGSIKTI